MAIRPETDVEIQMGGTFIQYVCTNKNNNF